MLTFRSVQLNTGTTVCLDLVQGYFEPAVPRGEDWIAYGLDGRTPGNRSLDERFIILEGYTRGIGETPADRLESFHDATAAVMAVMDTSAAPGTLSISSGYLGLPVGSEATIQARCTDVGSKRMTGYRSAPFQLWTIELLSVDPDWTFVPS